MGSPPQGEALSCAAGCNSDREPQQDRRSDIWLVDPRFPWECPCTDYRGRGLLAIRAVDQIISGLLLRDAEVTAVGIMG